MSSLVQSIHARALSASEKFRSSQKELIECFIQLDRRRGWLELGHPSLFAYATSGLSLTEDIAATLIRLARKSEEVPALKAAIESERVSISKARVIAPILNQGNQEDLLAKAAVLSKRELEREVARTFPEQAVQEQVRFVAPERLKVQVGISPELLAQLERVQELESQRTGQVATLEETLAAMAKIYLAKQDPVEKAKRAERKKPQSSAPGRGAQQRQKQQQRRSKIPAAVRDQIHARDGGRCAWRDPMTGERCRNKKFIDTHHIQPRSLGGADTAENLITLCSGHHKLEHLTDLRPSRLQGFDLLLPIPR